MEINKIYQYNSMQRPWPVADNSIDCCVTSPPFYGLRDYGHADQLGLEETPELYVANMVAVFEEVRRVLKPEGTAWVNLGDSYCSTAPGTMCAGSKNFDSKDGIVGKTRIRPLTPSGMKPKDLIGIPWMVAFALRSAGWYLRQDIIWAKPNPMPESVTDRCTKSHEYIFLLSKSQKYYYDADSIDEPSIEPVRLREKNNGESAVDTKLRGYDSNCGNTGTRNKRSVWTVTTKPYKESHFATFPQDLIVDMIKAGSSEYGCCAECGKPWERDMELIGTKISGNPRGNNATINPNRHPGEEHLTEFKQKVFNQLGWKPTCKCQTEEVLPSIILDPFIGAGTTGLVARKLNRNFIGFEINPAYIRLAERRLKKELGMFI